MWWCECQCGNTIVAYEGFELAWKKTGENEMTAFFRCPKCKTPQADGFVKTDIDGLISSVWCNQGYRKAVVLTKIQNEQLIEYTMPSDHKSLRIYDLSDHDHGGKSFKVTSWAKLPKKFRETNPMAMNTYEVISKALVKARDEESAKKKFEWLFSHLKIKNAAKHDIANLTTEATLLFEKSGKKVVPSKRKGRILERPTSDEED